MTIEVTKKQIIIALVAIVLVALCIGGGYALHSSGYYLGFEEGHSVGVAETEKKYQNPKGDGSVWYAEKVDINFRYHSTNACPYIKNGIRKNWGYLDHNDRKKHSEFCPKCMDFYLISKCADWLYEDRDWK